MELGAWLGLSGFVVSGNEGSSLSGFLVQGSFPVPESLVNFLSVLALS